MEIPGSLVLTVRGLVAAAVPFALIAGAAAGAQAQSASSLSACEAPPAVQAAYDGPLSQDSLAKLTITERDAEQKRVLEDLLAKYPREYSLYVRQMDAIQFSGKNDEGKTAFEDLRARWVKNAKDHPDDPVALLAAGKILVGKDTPEAIRLMEAAKAKAPEYPWPAHELADLYAGGRYENDARMKENLERFYSLCPAWTSDSYFGNQMEGFRLRKDMPLIGKTAVALRARLERETDPKRLEDYQVLWQREFLTRPPSEHDAERARIQQDLQRIEPLAPHGDAVWRAFLIEGYRLSGASNEELARMQEDAARDFPHEGPAYSQAWDRFRKEHPRPDGPRDTEAWKACYAAEIELVKNNLREFPDIVFAQRSEPFEIALDDPYISREDGLAAMEGYLKAMDEYGGYGTLSFMPSDPPRFLLEHGWEPERALELLKKTSTYRDGGHTHVNWQDNIADSDLKRFKKFGDRDDRTTLGLILEAAARTSHPEEALKFRSAIEEPPPADEGGLTQYWTNRARLAVFEKRPQDALVYYRLAVDSRTEPVTYRNGVLRDDVMAEFHQLWTAQGGTETAWAAWNPKTEQSSGAQAVQNQAAQNQDAQSQGAGARTVTAADQKNKQPQGEWKDAPKDLPSFELSDFHGKTWRMADLKGRVVMVTSWATWCGPCRLEDQNLEKFYEKQKGRKDLAILTFNVDENPGEVLPFMQKQGYTFPVLAASSIPEKMRQLVPRTWIIDPHGQWLWVKDGYDDAQSYADFEKEMLDRVGRAQAGQ